MTESHGSAASPAHPTPVTGPITIPEAATRLARLGFLAINGTEPWAPGGAQLLVALRDIPTLLHFDPEVVQHWVVTGGHGRVVEVTRDGTWPLRRSFSWGSIRVTDRLDVYNSFLTFGGEIEADRLDAHTVICVLRSPAAIGRSTGHSQEPDPLAGAIGSFFARMKIPVEDTPGEEERVGALTPIELYATFLHVKELQRQRSHRIDPEIVDDAVTRWILSEKRRVSALDPRAWETGVTMTTELGLDRV